MIDANGFPTVYGSDLIPEIVTDRWIAVTQPEPWEFVSSRVARPPELVLPATSLDVDTLAAAVEQARRAADHGAVTVVGVGGGTAMDVAKWIQCQLGLRLVQIPSLPSVNACFTRMTAIRDQGRVRYEGDAVPDVVVVDLDLVTAAPPHLVRGGIGDVLSCHTALHDWRLGAAVGRDAPWDHTAARAASGYLDELEDLAPGLAHGEHDAIIRLMECHRDIGWRCHELGHARFEEGSEHFLAYSFEEVTGRTIMHGELVTLGVIVMSSIQRNDPERPRRIAGLAEARTDLDDLGIGWNELEAALRRLPGHVGEHHLWYSIANELVVDDDVLDTVRGALRAH